MQFKCNVCNSGNKSGIDLGCTSCKKESGYELEGSPDDYIDLDYDPIEEVHE